MRDSVELDWAGVASVCIAHSALAGSARAMAQISGHDDYPFITVDYPFVPFAVWTPEEIAALALELTPKVRAALTLG